MTKISIKLKRQSPPQGVEVATNRVKVSYIFTSKGGFLYHRDSGNLYSVDAPHRLMGTLDQMGVEDDE